MAAPGSRERGVGTMFGSVFCSVWESRVENMEGFVGGERVGETMVVTGSIDTTVVAGAGVWCLGQWVLQAGGYFTTMIP